MYYDIINALPADYMSRLSKTWEGAYFYTVDMLKDLSIDRYDEDMEKAGDLCLGTSFHWVVLVNNRRCQKESGISHNCDWNYDISRHSVYESFKENRNDTEPN